VLSVKEGRGGNLKDSAARTLKESHV